MKSDRSFDAIAGKFAKNIYGTSKGKVREAVLQRDLADISWLHSGQPKTILDVGGGQGQLALFLAKLGHQVTVLDISQDMLELAKQQASAEGVIERMRFVHAPLQDLPNLQLGQFDLVLCHAVLEWLVDQQHALTLLADQVCDQGYLSLMYYNKDGKRLANVVFGNFEYVENDLTVKKKVSLNPNQPLNATDVANWLQALPLTVLSKSGVRCFHDYIRDRSLWQSALPQLLALELRYNRQEPYASIGRYTHLLMQKTPK